MINCQVTFPSSSEISFITRVTRLFSFPRTVTDECEEEWLVAAEILLSQLSLPHHCIHQDRRVPFQGAAALLTKRSYIHSLNHPNVPLEDLLLEGGPWADEETEERLLSLSFPKRVSA